MLRWTLRSIFVGATLLVTLNAFSLQPSLAAASGQNFNGFSLEALKSIRQGTQWFDASGDDTCGTSGAGPVGEVNFPSGVSTSDLSSRIKTYIQATKPSSPLATFADDFVKYGKQYNVNPVLVIAIGQKESGLGTTGHGPAPQFNSFGIRGSGRGGFRDFPDYPTSIEGVNKLLASSLYLGPPANYTTITQVMFRYAPPADHNDTTGYIAFINDILNKLLGSGASATGQSADCKQTNSGTVSADGYAFPVAPQKKSENGGVPGMSALPCLSNSCHHDGTPAFDISRKPGGDSIAGTPEYAISDGTISDVHIYKDHTGCYSLQLLSSKDQFYYWYGHMQNPIVKDGDKVKAGQQIAEIGVRACTDNGSDPHLHIDRGCVRGGVHEKGGLASCRDAGLIPIINALWQQLPQ